MEATTMTHHDRFEKCLTVLLRDFGFRFSDGVLTRRGTSFSPAVVGRRRSLFDAVESLVPVVREDEFTNRFLAAQVNA
jgi:hypothetical protein